MAKDDALGGKKNARQTRNIDQQQNDRRRQSSSRFAKAGALIISCFAVDWILTLGVFVSSRSDGSVSEDGRGNTSRVDVRARAYIGVGNVHRSGIPFLYCSTTDRGPFPLNCIIEIVGGSKKDELEITALEVGDHQQYEQVDLKNALHGDGDLIKANGEVATQFTLNFPKAIRAARACRVRIAGNVVRTGTREKIPFLISLHVPFNRRATSTTGWMKLLYLNHF